MPPDSRLPSCCFLSGAAFTGRPRPANSPAAADPPAAVSTPVQAAALSLPSSSGPRWLPTRLVQPSRRPRSTWSRPPAVAAAAVTAQGNRADPTSSGGGDPVTPVAGAALTMLLDVMPSTRPGRRHRPPDDPDDLTAALRLVCSGETGVALGRPCDRRAAGRTPADRPWPADRAPRTWIGVAGRLGGREAATEAAPPGELGSGARPAGRAGRGVRPSGVAEAGPNGSSRGAVGRPGDGRSAVVRLPPQRSTGAAERRAAGCGPIDSGEEFERQEGGRAGVFGTCLPRAIRSRDSEQAKAWHLRDAEVDGSRQASGRRRSLALAWEEGQVEVGPG